MIGPPRLPKIGRRELLSAASRPVRRHSVLQPLKWAAGLYFAGVLAHFGHTMAVNLPAGGDPGKVLSSAPISLVWPADLIGTLIHLSRAQEVALAAAWRGAASPALEPRVTTSAAAG